MLVGLVAEDLRVRRRLAALLGVAGVGVAAEAGDAASFVAGLAGGAPGAIIVASPDAPSITVEIKALRRRLREVPIVALIRTADEGECRRAISAGADGAVVDRDLEDTLVATVTAAVAGQISFPRGLQGAAGGPSLTPRERQVLNSVVIGLKNAQIADQLGLAESTVKSHLSSAFTKLGVASRAEAAALIREQAPAPRLDTSSIGSDANA